LIASDPAACAPSDAGAAAHFAAFSFVDRITDFVAGSKARAVFWVPQHLRAFPPCLVAEAVGQLAAWAAMSKSGFRRRPVAALATETRFCANVLPGQTLELAVDIEDCDDDMVVYGGTAVADAKRVIELENCLGPMLPVEDFDAPDALRARLELLRGAGAERGRFKGVELPESTWIDHVPGTSARALLQVPREAAFFGDHFPRNPVFPATLLLDAQIRVAAELVRRRRGSAAAQPLASRMTHVKMRAFIAPGQEVELGATLAGDDSTGARVMLSAQVAGKNVATARVEFVPEESA
jgi:3-hydroxymyristoyl/3-hydroxydecanoyl-(acyl carrier protein) dehydratase